MKVVWDLEVMDMLLFTSLIGMDQKYSRFNIINKPHNIIQSIKSSGRGDSGGEDEILLLMKIQ